ncbi:pyocin knob domain-containing protein [Longirhabdus pacifica]|uniref:pyocin knob domain-containing protein n=1 Tax=Longirhabdus pacifica TaxID=2305227 RepID=UPI0010088DB5|nr:pyocin knob domain-containing protein [Longirhabdus pacifica]
MKQTTHYNLNKIQLTDSPPDITAINPNWDTIDDKLKEQADSIEQKIEERAVENELNPIDPNTTEEVYVLTNHQHSPSTAKWYIRTYRSQQEGEERTQVAISHQDSSQLYMRYYHQGAWSAWVKTLTEDDVLKPSAANTSIADTSNNFSANEVEGALKELHDGKLFRKKLEPPSGWTSYQKAVIILQPIGISDESNSAPIATVFGTFYFSRKSYPYSVSAQVITQSGYTKSYNQGSIITHASTSFSVDGKAKLVEFDYEGIRYLGIDTFWSDAEFQEVYFHGESIYGVNSNFLKWIKYSNTKTEEVYNTEINDSIVEFTPPKYRHNLRVDNQLVYHEGNSYPIVESDSNSNGEYVRFADGTQICSRRVKHDFNSYYTQRWLFPASFTSISGLGWGLLGNKVEGQVLDTTYWDNAHKTFAGIYKLTHWITLSRETLFDAKGYIYLTAIGKWK